MASWAVPHDWIAGDLASTSSASRVVDMNQQVYGNLDWLGSTHDHAGGTRGNDQVGPVMYMDLVSDGTGATGITATVQRMWSSGTAGTTIWVGNGTTSSFTAANSTHSHS